MQTTINQRIKKMLDEKEYTRHFLSDKCGITVQAIEQWVNNKTTPKDQQIIKLVYACEKINARWLITGEGDMLGMNENAKDLNDKQASYGKDTLQFISDLSKEVGRLETKVKDLETDNRKLREKFGEQDQKRARAG